MYISDRVNRGLENIVIFAEGAAFPFVAATSGRHIANTGLRAYESDREFVSLDADQGYNFQRQRSLHKIGIIVGLNLVALSLDWEFDTYTVLMYTNAASAIYETVRFLVRRSSLVNW